MYIMMIWHTYTLFIFTNLNFFPMSTLHLWNNSKNDNKEKMKKMIGLFPNTKTKSTSLPITLGLFFCLMCIFFSFNTYFLGIHLYIQNYWMKMYQLLKRTDRVCQTILKKAVSIHAPTNKQWLHPEILLLSTNP